jgi:iron complex outermembrane receptor protein
LKLKFNNKIRKGENIMKRVFAICLASSAAWSVVTPALAQSVPPVAAAPQDQQIADIIVTAQRRSERAQSTPLAITAVSGKDLQSSGIKSIEGLSQNIPNVQFGGNGGDAKIFIRGVGYDSISPGGETRVAIYTNNVYQSRSQTAFTTLYDVDRVEVLRGPQGTLYGRNAVAGAINILTADPGKQLNGYLSGQVGNYGLIQTEGAIGGPVTDGLSVRVAGQTVDRSGYGHNIGTGNPVNDAHSRSVRLTLVANLAENVRDRLVADYYNERDHAFGYRLLGASFPGAAYIPKAIVLGDRVPTNLQDAAGRGPFNHLQAYGVSNELSLNVSDLLTVTSVTGYRHLTSHVVDSVYGGVKDLEPQSLYEDSDSVTQELRLSGDSGRFKYVVGGYYFYEDHATDNRVTANALLFPPLPPFGPYAGTNNFLQFLTTGGYEKTNAYAAFGQADIGLFSGLTLSLGLRYSHEKKDLREFKVLDFKTLYDNSLPLVPLFPSAGLTSKTASYTSTDPRLSLNYQFNPHVIGYVTYSQGFKSGGFNIGGTQPAFDPERIKDYEIGLKGDYFGGRLRANISAFYYDYTNLQVNEIIGLSLVTLNAASAKVKGVEAEVTALPATNLRVSINGAWLDATYKDFKTADPARAALGKLDLAGKQLTYAPKYKVGASVAYTIPSPLGMFTPTADVTWTDRVYFTQYNTDRLSQPSHANLNLFVRWVGNNPDWTGSVFVRNVTNKVYITGAAVASGTVNFYRAGQVSAPRTFGAQLTRHF